MAAKYSLGNDGLLVEHVGDWAKIQRVTHFTGCAGFCSPPRHYQLSASWSAEPYYKRVNLAALAQQQHRRLSTPAVNDRPSLNGPGRNKRPSGRLIAGQADPARGARCHRQSDTTPLAAHCRGLARIGAWRIGAQNFVGDCARAFMDVNWARRRGAQIVMNRRQRAPGHDRATIR
jgi:hypothetical protein